MEFTEYHFYPITLFLNNRQFSIKIKGSDSLIARFYDYYSHGKCNIIDRTLPLNLTIENSGKQKIITIVYVHSI